jgi:hypothetical protein
MTKEEKQLLLTDLCARLPYGVMCKIQTRFVFEDGTLRRGSYDEILDLDTVTDINEWKETGELEKFKPYLRPMSSMTEEEEKEYFGYYFFEKNCFANTCGAYRLLEWLNAHHFDYRGLIEKGLALEAPEGMYK